MDNLLKAIAHALLAVAYKTDPKFDDFAKMQNHLSEAERCLNLAGDAKISASVTVEDLMRRGVPFEAGTAVVKAKPSPAGA